MLFSNEVVATMLFDKKSIEIIKSKTKDFDWFLDRVDSSFSIPDDENIVIFGFNGVGKSTLIKLFKALPVPSAYYMDYLNEGGVNDLNSGMSDKDTKITLKVNVSAINKLIDAKTIEERNYKTAIKNGLTDKSKIHTKTIAKHFSNKVINAQADNEIDELTTPVKTIKEITSNIGNIPISVFSECKSYLDKAVVVTDEIKSLKDEHLSKALNELNFIVDDSDTNCPVCGQSFPKIKERIECLAKQLNVARDNLSVKVLKLYQISPSKEQISALVETYSSFKKDSGLESDYLICGGDDSIYSSINQSLGNISELKKEIDSLNDKAKSAFDSVYKEKNRFENEMKTYFDATDFQWNQKEYSVSFVLERPYSTYSTGEKNLLVFLFHIYEFLGSDNKVMFLDDPVSSLDLINQYKIAYEIVRTANKGKHIVALSHSTTFLNSINGQYDKFFKFYYIEECKKVRYLQSISTSHLQGRDTCLISLKGIEPFIDVDGLIIDLRERCYSVLKIDPFHYSPTETFGTSKKYSNYSLIKEIDGFSGFTFNSDFFVNTYEKIRKCIALRLWIEKELYELIPQGSVEQSKFFSKECWTIVEKLNLLVDQDGKPKEGIILPSAFKRDVFMSKKVMLNETIHYDSQVMPFAYAINLSLDDLESEIKSIKSLFGK
jgi:ABC-type molybdenum transport system ATPase subunit/photorepair protein PhrA